MNDDRIEEYLDRWEDFQQQGREVSAEELCPQEPELWVELRRRIEALKRTSWLVQPGDEPNDEQLGRTPADFDLPDVLGRYRLEELIGSGGFGQVWRAFDPDLHRQVAIKIPRPDRLTSPEQTERFLAEARHIAQLRHPGIVAVYDVGQHDGRCFIVTDLIATGNLAERIDAGRLEPQQAACIVRQICEALESAHRQSIVHRDIKPSNILIDADERALLADFGIAMTIEEHQTNGSVPFGTLAFMSPEQLRGENIDGRSDIYSLGVVLYQLLTGQLLFTKDNPLELRKHIEGGVSENIFGRTDEVPPRLRSICLKAMSANPDDRFSSASEMAAALRLASEEQPNRSGKLWVLLALGLLVVVGFVLWSFRWWEKPIDDGDQTRANVAHSTDEPVIETARPSVATSNVAVLENVHHFAGHTGSVHSVAISQDGLHLASGGEDQTVRLWRLDEEDAKPAIMKQFANVTALTFSPDGRFLSCGCDNGLVRRWRISGEEPKEVVVYPGEGAVQVMASSSDKRFLAAGDEGGITRLWKLGPQPAKLATFPKAKGPILEVAFPSSGDQIIIGIGSEGDRPGEVWFWKVDGNGPNAEIQPISTRSLAGIVAVSEMAISLDGRTIVAGNQSGKIAVWQAEDNLITTGRFNARFIGTFDPHTATITSLCLAESGEWCFSVADDGAGILWTIPDLKQKARLPEGISPVLSVTRSVDGQQLITGHSDGSIRTWKVPQ